MINWMEQMTLKVQKIFLYVGFVVLTLPVALAIAEDKIVEKLVSQYLSFWETRGGITSKGVDVLMKRAGKCHEFQRFEVRDGKVYTVEDPHCTNTQQDKFSVLVKSHIFRVAPTCSFIKEKHLNFQFVVNIKDEPNQLKTKVYETKDVYGTWEAPLLSFQTTSDHLDVPIEYSRDDQALQKFLEEDTMMAQNDFGHGNVSLWKRKKPILFWRGSQTGGWYTVQNWKSFPRSKLVLLSKENPDIIDAGFSSWSQIYPRAVKQVQREVGLKSPVTMLEHAQWRYLASLDGNGWANRLPFLLVLGSLVFKQDSPFYTWWYPLLEPWVHYLPLNRSLQDTVDKIRWAKGNDKQAESIAHKGKQFVHEFLVNMTDMYMCTLLRDYASLYHL